MIMNYSMRIALVHLYFKMYFRSKMHKIVHLNFFTLFIYLFHKNTLIQKYIYLNI